MTDPVIQVRFYYNEPAFGSFEEAVAAASKNQRNVLARKLTAQVRGQRILVVDWDHEELRLSLEYDAQLRFFLSADRIDFELLEPNQSLRKPGGDDWPHVVQLGGQTEFEWDRAAIRSHLLRARVHSVFAYHYGAGVDIGNATCLVASRMYCVDLNRDVNYFEFDVDPDR